MKSERRDGAFAIIESESLRVTVDTLVGGTITAIEHKGIGASILGQTPWPRETGLPADIAAPDEITWLKHYTGGWPVLFPNGGDACTFDGIFHGFHGEASLATWAVEIEESSKLRMSYRFTTVPVEMHRTLNVAGAILTIEETVCMQGSRPVQVMWGQHPTFGSDLLAAAFEIQTGALSVSVDDRVDSDANPLVPGTTGIWPLAQGKDGIFDLSRPHGKLAAMAYLHRFDSAWVSIRRLDDSVGAVLSWDPAVFPVAWLWYELEGTAEPPWNGKTRLIGIEPNTTWPANGLTEAARRGASLLTLQSGTEITTTIRLNVFKPEGPVRGINASGAAILA